MLWTCSHLQDGPVRETETASCFHLSRAEAARNLWGGFFGLYGWPRIRNTDSLWITFTVVYSWNKPSHINNKHDSEDKFEQRYCVNIVIESFGKYFQKISESVFCALVDIIWSFCATGVVIIILNAPLMSNEYLHRHLNTNALLKIVFAHEVPLLMHLYISLLARMWQ